MSPRRAALLIVVLAASVAVLAGPSWRRDPPPARTASTMARTDMARTDMARTDRPDPLAVLRAWDARRAAAWARGDGRALGALYTPGSRTADADLAMLRSYAARGLRVTGMRTQVLAVRVRAQRPDRIVLVVTDRLAGAVAVGAGTRLPLPVDAASTRTVSLRLVAGEWRVSEVRDQPSAAASTALTSRSRKS